MNFERVDSEPSFVLTMLRYRLPFVIFFISLVQLPLLVYSQPVDELKLGVGVSFLGTGDVYVVKLEGEALRRWNRYFSGSLAIGAGYGDSRWYENPEYITLFLRSATVHLDGNFFFSPFGNDRAYDFKIGTGPSLMYVRDPFYRGYPGWPQSEGSPEHRFSLGGSIIVEQEVRIRQQYTIGLKTMFQPYLNGDGAVTVLVKVGRTL